jgi:cell division protein FtsB
MFDEIKNFLSSKRAKQLVEVRNIGLYIFGVIVLAIAWSGAKTVQNNYELQKQINTLRQQDTVLSLQNENTGLQNQFYKTNEYLDLSARQELGLAAPGEQVLLVPRSVAMKYVDPALKSNQASSGSLQIDNRSKYVRDLEDWRDFLLGRKLFSN